MWLSSYSGVPVIGLGAVVATTLEMPEPGISRRLLVIAITRLWTLWGAVLTSLSSWVCLGL